MGGGGGGGHNHRQSSGLEQQELSEYKRHRLYAFDHIANGAVTCSLVPHFFCMIVFENTVFFFTTSWEWRLEARIASSSLADQPHSRVSRETNLQHAVANCISVV